MRKETLDRIGKDFPLIYFATVSGAVTTYMISTNDNNPFKWGYLGSILLITLLALGLIYGIYVLIYKVTN